MKPLIGVMPLWDDDKDSIWMLPGYMDGVQEAGGLPLIFPFTEDPAEIARLCALCDGFLMTGGHDVSPVLYGETPLSAELVKPCEKRDRMETQVLAYAIAQDKPVLGICRGLQLLNAALGGTLYQDLPLQHPSETPHTQRPPYDEPRHSLRVLPDTPLHALLGREELAVNSYHHQAICALAPGLRAMAVSPDGLIEAVWAPEQRFCWAVQWHPEYAFRRDENCRAIFRAFVAAAT